ncbi:hypothetical protein SPBR_04838 [Sporothrix brasiliensis 5110]|uniref:Uncharacterized protein n=1 Tax=Sporothrix brasiliensis 5110 TaxID=1398154 RepID=A0A0C2IS47_9PEZI|nr:uncharacterized protein SPBR_04838 [Sporothrix brasiliensis 5110]KIH87832.1 hypothetical protein SPBR_04838 [Sporothrix brasiliensis 5110]
MSAPEDTARSIQAALEPFVRPREEVAHIRRVLRAHLAACLKSDDNALDGSLALVDLSRDPEPLPETRGLQRAYLRALRANLEARREFDQRTQAASSASSASSAAAAGLDGGHDAGLSASSADGIGILKDHLTTVKLGRKRDRLQVINRYLDALGERPVAVAAGEDYLHPEFIYGDAITTLPSVPKAVVDGLAEDEMERAAATSKDATRSDSARQVAAADLERLVARLEKSALRAQLVLRREEKRLAAAKERSSRTSTSPSAAAKLQALGVARNELIAWMEAELSNAGDEIDDEDEEAAESSRQLRQSLLHGHEVVGGMGGLGGSDKKVQLENKLDDIRDKYNQYVEARRALVATVGTMAPSDEGPTKAAVPNPLFANMPQLLPNSGGDRTATAATTPSMPTAATSQSPSPAQAPKPAVSGAEKAAALGNLLLAPYFERLLAVARDQKADIAHKAHYNVLLAKRLKDTCQMLDHLADESQLLPRFGAANNGGGSGGARGGAAFLRKKALLAPEQGTTAAAAEGVSQRAAAWTNAADSAKIATFEAVFEKVEEGQVALERATQSLVEAERLLGRNPEDEGEGDDGKKVGTRKPGARQEQQSGDIWAKLDGELGLLKGDSRR